MLQPPNRVVLPSIKAKLAERSLEIRGKVASGEISWETVPSVNVTASRTGTKVSIIKIKVNSVPKTVSMSRVQNPRGWAWSLKLLPSEPTHLPFSERPAPIPSFDWAFMLHARWVLHAYPFMAAPDEQTEALQDERT